MTQGDDNYGVATAVEEDAANVAARARLEQRTANMEGLLMMQKMMDQAEGNENESDVYVDVTEDGNMQAVEMEI